MSYFQNFKKMYYSLSRGKNDLKLVPNMFSKSVFMKDALQNSNLLFKYALKDGERPEDIAFKMYGDASKHWIILLANDIMDPQYDWVMGQNHFRDFIDKKYSSIRLQLDQTETYTIDYTDDEIVYQGGESLSDSSTSATVVLYDSTNKILTVKSAQNQLANSEYIIGVSSNVSHKIVGIMYNNDGYEWASNTIHHYQVTESKFNSYDQIVTTDTYTVSAKDYDQTNHTVYDKDTLTTTTDTHSLSDGTTLTIKKQIAPVTCYDYENQLNEAKREIKIPRAEYAGRIEEQFKQLMGS